MTLALQQTDLYERLNHPENPAFIHLEKDLLKQDVWKLRQDLPPLAEEAQLKARQTISFQEISLPWLKELTKLAVLVAVGNRKWKLDHLTAVLSATKRFNIWLVEQGYLTPSITLTAQVIQQWSQQATDGQRQSLWGLLSIWRQLDCIQFQVNWPKPKKLPKYPKTIPEKIKYKIDLALEQLDKPVYLAFKLHESLGSRSQEIAKIPLDCLRWREGVFRIRLCTGKQDDRTQEQDLPEELVPLIQQQQVFVRQKFGDDFPWLFPNWTAWRKGFSTKAWPPIFTYYQEQLKRGNEKLNQLLKGIIQENDIRTHDGSLARVTTHMFRRTYATVADCMGKRPDQIQHALRHANPDMQDCYVYVSPKEQEKRIQRILVDKDGKSAVYRTDTDSEFLRQEWAARQVETGVCTRPSLIKECEFEYVCLGCEYVRFAREHLPQLLKVFQTNQKLLEHCLQEGKSDSRRANSARQLINLLEPIIASLQKTREQEVSR